MLSWNLLHCVVCRFIAWYVYLHTTQCSRFHYNIAAWEHVLIGISEHENVRIWAKSYDAMCGGGLRMLNHQKIENRRCSRSHGTPYIAHDTCHTIHATPCRAHHTLHTIHSTRYMPHHAEHTIESTRRSSLHTTRYIAHHTIHTTPYMPQHTCHTIHATR